jgi:hypothetical protein
VAKPVPLPEFVYRARLAWRALRIVLEQLSLTASAVVLNPDDPTQAFPGPDDGQVRFYEDRLGGRGRILATVTIRGTAAHIVVEDVRELVRLTHRKSVDPRELGIAQRPDRPDLDVDVSLAEVVERDGALLRSGRRRILPPSSAPRRPGNPSQPWGRW